VAAAVPGASINDVIDPARIDELSGTSALSGQPVSVESCVERSETPSERGSSASGASLRGSPREVEA
jgi:hypothetical protein